MYKNMGLAAAQNQQWFIVLYCFVNILIYCYHWQYRYGLVCSCIGRPRSAVRQQQLEWNQFWTLWFKTLIYDIDSNSEQYIWILATSNNFWQYTKHKFILLYCIVKTSCSTGFLAPYEMISYVEIWYHSVYILHHILVLFIFHIWYFIYDIICIWNSTLWFHMSTLQYDRVPNLDIIYMISYTVLIHN